MDIKKHFDLDDMANWNNYRAMINVPIYSTITKAKRGKAMCWQNAEILKNRENLRDWPQKIN
jgi:hypothetical protein